MSHLPSPARPVSAAGILLAATTLLVAAGAAPAEEFIEYPQFRHVSGLPGNGYGVTPEGDVGWEGAMSQCIPLGYTPSGGAVAFSYFSGSRLGGITFGTQGPEVNGTMAITAGFGPEGHGISVTADWVDFDFDVAMHVQGQVLEETDSRPAVSVGILDWANRREALLKDYDGDGARSFYAAATKRFGSTDRPLHVTLGIGTGRFRERPFAGVCYDVNRRLKILAEYDGWGLNAAAAAQVLPFNGGAWAPLAEGESAPPENDALNVFLGVADMRYPVVGLTYARRDVF